MILITKHIKYIIARKGTYKIYKKIYTEKRKCNFISTNDKKKKEIEPLKRTETKVSAYTF